MIITAVEKTKKGKYALFVDGEFAFSVTAEQLIQDHIQADRQVTAGELEQMLETSQRIFARERSLTLLSARSYTRKGLLDKLTPYVAEEIAWAAADRMEELRLINDEDYARRKASDLYKLKQYGRSRVEMALRQKGIDKELARDVAEALEPGDAAESAFALVERRHARLLLDAGDKDDFYKRRGKVQNALLRMGYDYEDIRSAIGRFMEENELYF